MTLHPQRQRHRCPFPAAAKAAVNDHERRHGDKPLIRPVPRRHAAAFDSTVEFQRDVYFRVRPSPHQVPTHRLPPANRSNRLATSPSQLMGLGCDPPTVMAPFLPPRPLDRRRHDPSELRTPRLQVSDIGARHRASTPSNAGLRPSRTALRRSVSRGRNEPRRRGVRARATSSSMAVSTDSWPGTVRAWALPVSLQRR